MENGRKEIMENVRYVHRGLGLHVTPYDNGAVTAQCHVPTGRACPRYRSAIGDWSQTVRPCEGCVHLDRVVSIVYTRYIYTFIHTYMIVPCRAWCHEAGAGRGIDAERSQRREVDEHTRDSHACYYQKANPSS